MFSWQLRHTRVVARQLQSDGVQQSPQDRFDAATLVEQYGNDTLSFFALRHDKNWFFSSTRRSFVAYRCVGKVAYVSGDPIGDAADVPDLLREFTAAAHRGGRRVALMAAGEQLAADYAGLGWRSIYIGDEAVVRPGTFSLEGRDVRKVRQSVNRLEKAGYSVEVLTPRECDDDTRKQIATVSRQWRRGQPERGFSMSMDSIFEHDQTSLVIARDADGTVAGFLQLLPAPPSDFSLGAMRRRLDTPNGLTEFMVVRALEWGKHNGVDAISLNFVCFRSLLHRQKGVAYRVLQQADRLVPIERLYRFNSKFSPHWKPRYAWVESYADLPATAYACAKLEGYLPGRSAPGANPLAA